MYDGTNWQLINSNKLVSSTSEGLVPKLPVSNRSNKFLNGHGQWVELPINKVLSAECPISPGTWVTYFKVNFYGTTATNIDSSSVICIRLSVLTTTGKYGDVILKLRAKYNNMYEWVEPYVEPPVWFNYTASITEAVTFEWETGANSSTEVNVFLKAKMNYDDEEAIYRVVNYAIREIDSAITFSYMEQ